MINYKGWIGFDLDGTVARYDSWTKWNEFGEPLPGMVEIMRTFLLAGFECRIVTARIPFDIHETCFCKLSGEAWTGHDMARAIGKWTGEHVGTRLRAQCHKDFDMVALFDDRAVQVVPNTGQTLCETLGAEAYSWRKILEAKP